VVCGACISEGVDSGVDSDVDSDVESGSPMPRSAEDFEGASEVVVGGFSAAVVCGGSCDVTAGVVVKVGVVET
jgi:hypothetical protein